MRRLLVLLLSLSLAACGFQLRGSYSLPWDTLYLGMPENSEMYAQIKRSVEASTPTRIVTDPKAAQASLVILRNEQAKNILSLSGKGLVREFQLTRTFVYRIQDAAGKELMAPSQIILQREMNFDDLRVFASEAEEITLWRDIQVDLVQQLLRRLSASSRAVKS
ncbi:MAG: LPS assembly lipoprotein LptE [Rhodocyclaceae bacterium]|nr:LPS assembly lipoprotein LptE [Rhodocyclaceae bacterium]